MLRVTLGRVVSVGKHTEKLNVSVYCASIGVWCFEVIIVNPEIRPEFLTLDDGQRFVMRARVHFVGIL